MNNAITQAIQVQVNALRANASTALLLVITSLMSLFIGWYHDAIIQSVAYLIAMWIFSLCADIYAIKKPTTIDFPVRNPKRESFYFVLSFLLGLTFLLLRYSPSIHWDTLPGLIKLAILPLMLFVFPVGITIILLLMKYKPHDLGIRFRGFILIVPVLLISAFTFWLVSPESHTLQRVIEEEGGIISALFTGFFAAGLSEEIFRVIGQTRLGAYFKNNALAWFVTTVIWAFFHAPKWYSDDQNLTEAIIGSVRIIPIGLMWGYLTYRTKSILPSVIVHGLNYWGLQNF
jgi:membrane protease YdiL (CAAX protease family)